MAEKQPGIVKKMTFGGEEFEVPFAKGNPGKSREELEEIKRRLAPRQGTARWSPRWASAPRTSLTPT